ncbi:MAG: ATP-binding cassette domain-containing protein [Desulforhopalus sp.]
MNKSLPQPILSLNDEDISYSGNVVLRCISLSVFKGEKVALIGQSGAGKTTLLRRLYQLRPKECAFVHQHNALVPQLSVFHNIYMGRLDRQSNLHNLWNLIRPMVTHMEEITPIAEKLGLKDKLFSKTGELSGGQQQRVGIGRALYCGGTILMADEPVSSLDMVQGKEIMALIAQAGKTVISTLHSVDLSRLFFDRIIGLRDQTIFFDLPPDRISGDLLVKLYG